MWDSEKIVNILLQYNGVLCNEVNLSEAFASMPLMLNILPIRKLMVKKNTTCPTAELPWLQSHGLERSAGNKVFNINLPAP
jgi:hypothetical protein